MRRSNLSVVLSLLLVFACGVLVGGFAHRLYTVNSVSAKSGPQEMRQRYLGEMKARLNLSQDQIGKLNAILDETRARWHELRAKSEPDMKQIKKDQFDRIRAILDDRQKLEYEKYRQEREMRMQQSQKRHTGGM